MSAANPKDSVLSEQPLVEPPMDGGQQVAQPHAVQPDKKKFREHVAGCPKCKSAKHLAEMCEQGVDLFLTVKRND